MTIFEKRRSIRRYTDEVVDPKVLEAILADAMQAPSAGNQQPWHFIVVTDRNTLDELAGLSPYAGMLLGAPMAICVVADRSGLKYPEMWEQDCAACTENLLLSAAEKGLGAVWLGVAPHVDRMDHVRKTLEIPEDLSPFAVLPMGFPTEEKQTPDRLKKERIHQERW